AGRPRTPSRTSSGVPRIGAHEEAFYRRWRVLISRGRPGAPEQRSLFRKAHLPLGSADDDSVLKRLSNAGVAADRKPWIRTARRLPQSPTRKLPTYTLQFASLDRLAPYLVNARKKGGLAQPWQDFFRYSAVRVARITMSSRKGNSLNWIGWP